MANKTVTVKPSGGDYTSLNAALAGESADLVTNTRILTIECYAMEDTTLAYTGTGYTTSADYYIKIIVPAAERHDGKWNTSKYRIYSASTGPALTIQEAYTQVIGLQATAYTTSGKGIIRTSGVGNCKFFSCWCRNLYRGAAFYGASGEVSGVPNVFVNCIGIVDVKRKDRDDNACFVATDGDVTYYNCTAYGNVTGGGIEYGFVGTEIYAINAYNCIAQNVGVCFFNFDGGSNNLSSDDTAPGTGSVTSTTLTFVNLAGLDLHLAAADTAAIDAGASDPGSGLYSDDIDGTTRSGSWDIGADEYVSAGGDPEGCLIAGKLLRGGLLMHGVLTRA